MMNISSCNTPTQLWIIARYTEAISLLLGLRFLTEPINYVKTITAYSLIVVYSALVAMNERLFPTCYIDGVGLSSFKIFSEYIICIILLITAYCLNKNKNKHTFLKNEYIYWDFSILFTILSELCFTLYSNVYGLANTLGHIFKLLSFCFIYIPLVRKSIKEPYTIIFNKLNESLEELKETNDQLNCKNQQLENIKTNLEKNLKIYKDFVEILPLGIVIRDKDTIVYINNKTKELLKLNSKKDLIGQSLLSMLEDSYKTIVRERINMEYKDKIGLPIEEKLICADGSTVDVQVSVTSIMLDGKEYFMGVLMDMTYLNKLKLAESKLEEKDQYEAIRREFFANISHELKTPINVIYSALQLEELYFNKNDYASVKKNSKTIKQNCMRLLRLVNNLIDITEIDSGFFKPILKCNNIVEIVEDTVLSVAGYVNNRNMDIIFDTELEEEYINCDAELIERIILNLISNSIKYGKIGGCIYVNIYNDDENSVLISIKDDGIGIPKEKQSTVFERLKKADGSFTRNCEGSGIGLSIVKAFVEIQDGTIELISEENLGTEVILKFPLIECSLALEEVCATESVNMEKGNIIKQVDMEFSDIYDL